MNQPQLIVRIVLVTICRLLINTSKRFIYTFAPALSRFLGVPLTSITSLIAINQGTSVFGIFLAPLGDRFGYKLMMLAGMSSLTVGMFAAGIFPIYTTLIFTVAIAGLGKVLFDPAIQAYVGTKVPFHRRGMVIGILELAWAGSSVIGIPLAGLLIEKTGWQNTFITFGVVSLVLLVLIIVVVPRDKGIGDDVVVSGSPVVVWRQLLKNRPAMSAILYFFFIGIANDNIFVVYSSWLESSYALSLVALGIGTSVIGFAEISGELLTATFSDRIGLKRAVYIGTTFSVISFLVLPFLNIGLPFALAALFLIFISFEFSIVSSFGLCTELAPESRATLMSGLFASAGIGRVIGASIGGPIWLNAGLPAIGIVSACTTFLGLLCLIWGLKGWKR